MKKEQQTLFKRALNSVISPSKKSASLLAITCVSILYPSYASSSEINIYSARKEALILPLLERFTAESGIDINLITGNADALLQRLKIEGKQSPADLFITVDAGRLHRAKEANVLQPATSAIIEQKVPNHLKDKDAHWHALSQRARVIFYAKDQVDPTELSTYEDLASSKWKNRICSRSSNNIYNQSLVASMIEVNGQETTQDWLNNFVKNFARPPVGGDNDQLKAAAAGQCDIAIANTYYFGRLINSDNSDENKVANKLGLFWPNQDRKDRGAHVNVSGIGITKSSRNKESAIKLIEFLLSDESQAWYAEVNNEYPVVKGAPFPTSLKPYGTFKADSLGLTILGENNRQAVQMMDKAGWK